MKTTRSRRCESAWKPNSGYWHLLTITHPLGRYSALPPLRVSSLFLLWHHAGVPGRPEITGFTKPAMERDVITLTCTTSGSKPAANIRWFRNDKEVQGKHVVWIPPSAVSPCFHLHHLRDFITVKLVSSAAAAAAAVHCTRVRALFLCPGRVFAGAVNCLACGQRCRCCRRRSRCCLNQRCPHFITWLRCGCTDQMSCLFLQDIPWLHALSWPSCFVLFFYVVMK